MPNDPMMQGSVPPMSPDAMASMKLGDLEAQFPGIISAVAQMIGGQKMPPSGTGQQMPTDRTAGIVDALRGR